MLAPEDPGFVAMAGNGPAVGRAEETEGWATKHGEAARTVRIDRVAGLANQVFRHDLAAETESDNVCPSAVSIEEMKSSHSR